MPTLDDNRIVQAFKRGESGALDQLVEKYQPVLRKWLGAWCDGDEGIEDLQQEIWLRLIKSLKSFPEGSNFKAWLFSVARYAFIDYLRSRGRRMELSLDATLRGDDDLSRLDMLADEVGDTAHLIEKSETRSRLMAAIDCLDEDLREVVLMRVARGMSYIEISEELGITVKTAQSRMEKGTLTLRRHLLV